MLKWLVACMLFSLPAMAQLDDNSCGSEYVYRKLRNDFTPWNNAKPNDPQPTLKILGSWTTTLAKTYKGYVCFTYINADWGIGSGFQPTDHEIYYIIAPNDTGEKILVFITTEAIALSH